MSHQSRNVCTLRMADLNSDRRKLFCEVKQEIIKLAHVLADMYSYGHLSYLAPCPGVLALFKPVLSHEEEACNKKYMVSSLITIVSILTTENPLYDDV